MDHISIPPPSQLNASNSRIRGNQISRYSGFWQARGFISIVLQIDIAKTGVSSLKASSTERGRNAGSNVIMWRIAPISGQKQNTLQSPPNRSQQGDYLHDSRNPEVQCRIRKVS